jgi:hypothetical protein
MASSRPSPYPLATRAAPPAAPPSPERPEPPSPERRFLYLSGEYMFEVVLRLDSIRWSGRFVQCHHHFYQVGTAQHLYMKFHWDGDWARAKDNHYTLIHDDGYIKVWRQRGHAEYQFLVELPVAVS